MDCIDEIERHIAVELYRLRPVIYEMVGRHFPHLTLCDVEERILSGVLHARKSAVEEVLPVYSPWWRHILSRTMVNNGKECEVQFLRLDSEGKFPVRKDCWLSRSKDVPGADDYLRTPMVLRSFTEITEGISADVFALLRYYYYDMLPVTDCAALMGMHDSGIYMPVKRDIMVDLMERIARRIGKRDFPDCGYEEVLADRIEFFDKYLDDGLSPGEYYEFDNLIDGDEGYREDFRVYTTLVFEICRLSRKRDEFLGSCLRGVGSGSIERMSGASPRKRKRHRWWKFW